MAAQKQQSGQSAFVASFRASSPYIHAHRGRTFVVAFGGEAVADTDFADLIHDIATLNSLGIKLVLVHGTRPQIEQCLKQSGGEIQYAGGLRVTDDDAMACVKQAAASVRLEIEAKLSMGLANTPMSGARIRVASGNFVTARPLGVRNGVDYCHTGEVRRLDVAGMQRRLDDGDIVLLSPLGYSPTGEVFNVSATDVASAAAIALNADKLLFLEEGAGLTDSRKRIIQQLTPAEAEAMLHKRSKLNEDARAHLQAAIRACRSGVRRTHLIRRRINGCLLLELFTRDGIGTLITADSYEAMRAARIEDVGGILELLQPLEEQGVLVRRSRELLENEIHHFMVCERDGTIIACAALYPFLKERAGELACLAVHEEYQKQGRGDELLQLIERQAKSQGLSKLFVLTTQTAHWFRERGFVSTAVDKLPMKRRELYNYRRNSKIFMKKL